MTIGLTYDLRSEYLAMGYSEDETAEFDREDTIEAIESALQTLGHRTEEGGKRQAAGDRPGRRSGAGTWFSTSPKDYTVLDVKPRYRLCWIFTRFPIPFPTRLSCLCPCTRE